MELTWVVCINAVSLYSFDIILLTFFLRFPASISARKPDPATNQLPSSLEKLTMEIVASTMIIVTITIEIVGSTVVTMDSKETGDHHQICNKNNGWFSG